YASLGRLDELLRQPTEISCEAALPLLSASADGEADAAETIVARAHAAGCSSCAQSLAAFPMFDLQLRALPTGAPSPRVDRAIAAFGGRAPRDVGLRVGLPRALVAGVAALLLLIGGLHRAIPAGTP